MSRSDPIEMLYRQLPDGSFIRDVFPPDTKGLLRLKAAAPLIGKTNQQACDVGLFSDEANQLDLCEMFHDSTEEE